MPFGGLAALAAVAVVGGGIVWLVRRNRQLEQQADFDRSVRSRKFGWRYDGTRDGRIDYRFAGGHGGVAWTMWHDSDRGDDSPTPKAYWLSENLRTPRLSLVILGRKRYGFESGMVGRVLIGVVSGLATAAAGGHENAPDKVQFYESASLLGEGGASFNDRFAVAVAPDMPRGWFDDDLRRRLLQWPAAGAKQFNPEEAVEINLGPAGLSIAVQKMPDDMAHWQHLAELGETIAARLVDARR